MTAPEDWGSHTEADASAYEWAHADRNDDDRPTLAEAEQDER